MEGPCLKIAAVTSNCFAFQPFTVPLWPLAAPGHRPVRHALLHLHGCHESRYRCQWETVVTGEGDLTWQASASFGSGGSCYYLIGASIWNGTLIEQRDNRVFGRERRSNSGYGWQLAQSFALVMLDTATQATATVVLPWPGRWIEAAAAETRRVYFSFDETVSLHYWRH